MAGKLPITCAQDGVRLALKVAPRAASDRVVGLAPTAGDGCALKLAVRAAPADGEANEAVLRFLAATLRLPRRDLSLAGGATGREKLVHIAGDPARLGALIAERLAPWLG